MASLFLRGFALVSLVAFTSLRSQVKGLYGSRGIAPIAGRLDALWSLKIPGVYTTRQLVMRFPTLLWLGASDRALVRLCTAGQLASLVLLSGRAPRTASLSIYTTYLSFVSVGSPFLNYQWDVLLLESALHAALVGQPSKRDPPWIALALVRILAWRLHMESGLAKLDSRDVTWRGRTACSFHFATQPLPTRLGWHAHHLPQRILKAATTGTLVMEAGASALALGPRRVRRAGFALLTGMQAAIAATGNFAFFNALSWVLCLPLLDDDSLPRWRFLRRLAPPARPRSRVMRAVHALAALPLAALSIMDAVERLLPRTVPRLSRARLARATASFRVVNSYGLFANMTTRRFEIAIEGSDDGAQWLRYRFRYKPDAASRAPRFVAPHQPRLDWQMWFAALGPPPEWFADLVTRLLEGSRDVLALLAENPFSKHPPRFVRAVLEDTTMTSREERGRTGAWWRARPVALYWPPSTLAP